MTRSVQWSGPAALAVLFLFVFLFSLTPIRSYDYYWHLATGRWIVENQRLPESDPFSLASHDEDWINGEWLFQIVLYGTNRVVGDDGVTVVKALVSAGLFVLLALYVGRSSSILVACVVAIAAWQGAAHRIDVRPESAALLLLPLAISIALERPTPRRTTLLALLTLLWINLHPSALLIGPILVLTIAGDAMGSGSDLRKFPWRARLTQVVACGLALLLNPYGAQGIAAPVDLARFLNQSGLTNLEWLPSSPLLFPLVFVATVATPMLWWFSGDRRGTAARLLVFFLFAFLAIRFVRNHAFFFVALPVILAPWLPRVAGIRARSALAAMGGIAVILVWIGHRPAGLGPDTNTFPVSAVDLLNKSGLRGNIYNPDQFGGYLIWNAYPERRTLTDGRNELYREFFDEYETARGDSRAWRALIEKYDLTLAVDEYRTEAIKVVDGVTGEISHMPASLAYFPRDQWALIGWDDVAMVFARRDRHPPETIARIEWRLVPDAESAEWATVGGSGPIAWEIDRAIDEIGQSRRLARLIQLIDSR